VEENKRLTTENTILNDVLVAAQAWIDSDNASEGQWQDLLDAVAYASTQQERS